MMWKHIYKKVSDASIGSNSCSDVRDVLSGGNGVGVCDEDVRWESRKGGDASSTEPGC